MRGMYVIFDIVLNHAGNVFGYVLDGQTNAPDAPFRDQPYPIMWHDENGNPAFPDMAEPPANLSDDAAVWPVELHRNDFFRREGRGADIPHAHGDFASLKQMVSESLDVDRTLIRAYQYVIAKLRRRCLPDRHVQGPSIRGSLTSSATRCANSRCSIGKKNFFTFGEVYHRVRMSWPSSSGRDRR